MEIDRTQSIEALEGDRWPDPAEGSTTLVTSVHELRRRPVGTLTAWDLARLIGQGVSLPWTLPLALDILEDTAPGQAEGGFYDDDVLYAVLTAKSPVWSDTPELTRRVRALLARLADLDPEIQRAADTFLATHSPA